MTTAARTYSSQNSHFYDQNGLPCHTIIGKTTKKPRPTNIKDARELQLLPSVTTILKILDRPALNEWKIEQSVLACMTAERKPGEEVDDFVHRILHEEQQQEGERQKAADRGTQIHEAIAGYFRGEEMIDELKTWLMPAIEGELLTRGILVSSERVLVGDGYAGTTDLIQETEAEYWMIDYKTTKKIPDPAKGGAWADHRLQLAAYAQAFADHLATAGGATKPIRTGNLYISTVNPGEFVFCAHEDWEPVYINGFAPLVQHWCWSNNYTPKQASSPQVSAYKLKEDVEKILKQAHENVVLDPRQTAAPASNVPPADDSEPPTSDTPPPAPGMKVPKNVEGKKVIWSVATATKPS